MFSVKTKEKENSPPWSYYYESHRSCYNISNECISKHLQTHTASLPQTLYNSALGSHRRQCRWNTPPSPGPSARCRRSENGTGRIVRTCCSFCLTTLRIKKKYTFDKCLLQVTLCLPYSSSTVYQGPGHWGREIFHIYNLSRAWLKGWNMFIILQTLDLLSCPLITLQPLYLLTWPLDGALSLLLNSITKCTLQLLYHIFKADCTKSRCNPLSAHCSDYHSLV